MLDSSRLWALALFNICMTACFVPEMFWFLMEEGVSAAIMCSSRSAICFLLQPQISINCFYPKKKIVHGVWICWDWWMKNSFNHFMVFFFSFSGGDEDWGNNYAEREACTIKKSKTGSVSGTTHPLLLWTTTNINLQKKQILKFLLLLKDLIFFPNISFKNFSNLSLGCTERSSRRSSDRVPRGKIDHEASQVTDVNNYKYAAYALVLFSWTNLYHWNSCS